MNTWFWIVGWFLSIVTIAGNGFIIFLVGGKRRLRTKTNAFVVSLGLADFCVGLSVIPSKYFCDNSCKWRTQGEVPWMDLVRWPFGYASVTNLCSLVLDRYIAVVKPLKYLTFMTSRRVKQMIFFSWVIPVVLEILPLSYVISSKPVIFDIFNSLVMVLFEFLPCIMLIFSIGSMVHILLEHDRVARMLANELRFNHRVRFKTHEKTTVKIMGIVVGLFLVCYGIFIRCSIVPVFSSSCEDDAFKLPILVNEHTLNCLRSSTKIKRLYYDFKVN